MIETPISDAAWWYDEDNNKVVHLAAAQALEIQLISSRKEIARLELELEVWQHPH